MGDRVILNSVKTILQDNLTDPYEQWSGVDRTWIHTDEPLNSATFPRIQVRKRGPTNTEIISMGRTDFLEQRILTVDIQILTAAGFKYNVGSSVYIKDEELVKEWLGKIWTTLKSQHNTFINTYAVTGLKNLGEGKPYYEPDTQKYTGIISVRLWEFVR